MAASRSRPLGWPAEVPPPTDPDWERRAIGWLLDQAPGDWRGIQVLARHPVALAELVGDHVAAARSGLRAGVGGLRARLAGQVPPTAVEEIVSAMLGQEAVLARVAREIELVGSALRAVGRSHA